MKTGDKVRVIDISWMIRVDSFQPRCNTGAGWEETTFQIVGHEVGPYLSSASGHQRHDVFIKNTRNGKIYLHSKAYLVPETVKEVTIKELEDHFGCPVKIIK